MMQGVVVAFPLSVIGGPADVVLRLAPDVKGRHARLGEFKIIGPEEAPFLRLAIWLGDSSLALRRLRKQIVERGIPGADVLDVARFAPGIDDVDVDVGQGVIERVKRTLSVILR